MAVKLSKEAAEAAIEQSLKTGAKQLDEFATAIAKALDNGDNAKYLELAIKKQTLEAVQTAVRQNMDELITSMVKGSGDDVFLGLSKQSSKLTFKKAIKATGLVAGGIALGSTAFDILDEYRNKLSTTLKVTKIDKDDEGNAVIYVVNEKGLTYIKSDVLQIEGSGMPEFDIKFTDAETDEISTEKIYTNTPISWAREYTDDDDVKFMCLDTDYGKMIFEETGEVIGDVAEGTGGWLADVTGIDDIWSIITKVFIGAVIAVIVFFVIFKVLIPMLRNKKE